MATLAVDEEQPSRRGCAADLTAEHETQGLTATYTFDAPALPEPSSVIVRFVGVRVRVPGHPEAGDRFERVERVEGLTAASGRVALTTRLQGTTSGEWRVLAVPEIEGRDSSAGGHLPRRVIATQTTFGVLAQAPSVRLAAWPLLVGLGAVVAIVVQALLAAQADMDVAVVLALSLSGCAVGFVGGKVWYLVLHRKPPREFLASGACIQGFLLFAFAWLAVGAAFLRLPAGALLDLTTPGFLLGMALGRPGCFLTGCCAGRPTVSRWGRWSSDRRLGIRRVPVQLLEATVAAVLGLLTLMLVVTVKPPLPGAIFLGGLAAYTLARQMLFPLRAQTRTPRGRMVTMATCVLVLLAVVVGALLA